MAMVIKKQSQISESLVGVSFDGSPLPLDYTFEQRAQFYLAKTTEKSFESEKLDSRATQRGADYD